MITLEPPSAGRQREFLAAVKRSRALHGAWVSPPATPAQYRRYLERARDGNFIGHFVCTGGELAGVVNVTEIVRGVFCSGYLGFYAFVPHAGRGIMRAGLERAVSGSFRSDGMHRLEANIQPGNGRSIALVKSLGFRLEGVSPRYLKIGGRWRDHERWAVTVEEWGGPRTRRPESRTT
jgi:[ribosomal protein S5]-alanine N-acetyltransferase